MITTGIDIVSVKRIRKILLEKKTLFFKRVFTASEIEYCEQKIDKAPYYAARFAAKEAFIKAFPIKEMVFAYSDIEVRKKGDLPFIFINSDDMQCMEKYQISLSISHEKDYAIANVIIVAN